MRIIHLLSNCKWTERSEPVTDLVLEQQRLGHEASLICGTWMAPPAPDNPEYCAEDHIRAKGLNPIALYMNKHFHWLNTWSDVRRLRSILNERKPDILHAHLMNAHLLGALALSMQSRRIPLIRSSYEPDGPERTLRSKVLLHSSTDGLIVLNSHARDLVHNYSAGHTTQIATIEPGIDLERFSPAAQQNRAREFFDINPAHFVVGMVSRIRHDRRFDLVLHALRRIADAYTDIRLLVVGGGEHEQEFKNMIHELSLEDLVIHAGYCNGEQLVDAYRAMDVLCYPVPGTDKSARTVREAIATGTPVVAGTVGFLPELIEQGVTGSLTELNADDMARSLEQFYARRHDHGDVRTVCRNVAEQRFSLSQQAQRTLEFYDSIMQRHSSSNEMTS